MAIRAKESPRTHQRPYSYVECAVAASAVLKGSLEKAGRFGIGSDGLSIGQVVDA
jgi:hypothetical protein